MGQAQRQEYLDELAYGNGEPAHSKANAHRTEALRLEDLVGDPIYFELADRAELPAF